MEFVTKCLKFVKSLAPNASDFEIDHAARADFDAAVKSYLLRPLAKLGSKKNRTADEQIEYNRLHNAVRDVVVPILIRELFHQFPSAKKRTAMIETVVQNVLTKFFLWVDSGRYDLDSKATLATFFYKAIRNEALYYFRKNRNIGDGNGNGGEDQVPIVELHPSKESSADSHSMARETASTMFSLVEGSLTSYQKQTLRAIVDGESIDEVATRTGRNYFAVGQMVRQSLERVSKARMKHYQLEHEAEPITVEVIRLLKEFAPKEYQRALPPL